MSELYYKIKVIGERNTGTNFVNQVLNASFVTSDIGRLDRFIAKVFRPVSFILSKFDQAYAEWLHDKRHAMFHRWIHGWKHQALRIEEIDSSILYVCIIRHPIAWEKSFIRRPYQSLIGRDPNDLNNKNWILTQRDKLASGTLNNFRELWNLKYQSYHICANKFDNVLILKYEDFLEQPDYIFEKLKTYLMPTRDSIYLPKSNSKFRGGDNLSTYVERVQLMKNDDMDMSLYDPMLLDTYYFSDKK